MFYLHSETWNTVRVESEADFARQLIFTYKSKQSRSVLKLGNHV